jgi:hypothetical protein
MCVYNTRESKSRRQKMSPNINKPKNTRGLEFKSKLKVLLDAVTRIDFDIIDSIKLILTKIDFKLKWFMFEYIHAKVS